jgi:hypothetical protein
MIRKSRCNTGLSVRQKPVAAFVTDLQPTGYRLKHNRVTRFQLYLDGAWKLGAEEGGSRSPSLLLQRETSPKRWMDYLAMFRLGRRSHSQVLDNVPNVPQAATWRAVPAEFGRQSEKGSEAAVASGSRRIANL